MSNESAFLPINNCFRKKTKVPLLTNSKHQTEISFDPRNFLLFPVSLRSDVTPQRRGLIPSVGFLALRVKAAGSKRLVWL